MMATRISIYERWGRQWSIGTTLEWLQQHYPALPASNAAEIELMTARRLQVAEFVRDLLDDAKQAINIDPTAHYHASADGRAKAQRLTADALEIMRVYF